MQCTVLSRRWFSALVLHTTVVHGNFLLRRYNYECKAYIINGLRTGSVSRQLGGGTTVEGVRERVIGPEERKGWWTQRDLKVEEGRC